MDTSILQQSSLPGYGAAANPSRPRASADDTAHLVITLPVTPHRLLQQPVPHRSRQPDHLPPDPDLDAGLDFARVSSHPTRPSPPWQHPYTTPLLFLLLLVPPGLAVVLLEPDLPAPVFALTLLAAPLLAHLLSRSAHAVAPRLPAPAAALLTTAAGNPLELALCLTTPPTATPSHARAVAAGAVLAALLLVLGAVLLAGGLVYYQARLQRAPGEAHAGLLGLAALGLAVPAVFALARPLAHRALQVLSLATSVALLLAFALYLLFRTRTHADLYGRARDAGRGEEGYRVADALPEPLEGLPTTPVMEGLQQREAAGSGNRLLEELPPLSPPRMVMDAAELVAGLVIQGHGRDTDPSLGSSDSFSVDTAPDEDGTVPTPTPLAAAVTILVLSTALIVQSAQLLLGTLTGFAKVAHLSERFVATIILPVAGHAALCARAVSAARAGRMDAAVESACGSGVRVALFVAPVAVVASWRPGAERLTLDFGAFLTVTIVFASFVANAALKDGRTNWLEGAVLVMSYLIMAAAVFMLP